MYHLALIDGKPAAEGTAPGRGRCTQTPTFRLPITKKYSSALLLFFPLVSAIWPIFERKWGRCLIPKLVMTRLLNQRIWSDTGQAIINFSHCFAYHCTFLVNSVFALDLPDFYKYLVCNMTHLQTLFSTDICFYLFIR